MWVSHEFHFAIFLWAKAFSLFRYILPLEKVCPFKRTNLNPLHPRMLYSKLGWKCKSLQLAYEKSTGNQKSLLELSAVVRQKSENHVNSFQYINSSEFFWNFSEFIWNSGEFDIFFSRTSGVISTKLGTKRLWMKCHVRRAGTMWRVKFDSVRCGFKTLWFGYFQISSVHIKENHSCKKKVNMASINHLF